MKRIKVTNFRKVKESWEIELGPITFFTGPNNSGKSSILKALMILSDYGQSDNHLELSFRGENKWDHKVDCYQNAANWNNFKEGKHEIEFSFDNDDFETTLRFRPLIQPLRKTEKIQSGFLEFINIKRISDGSWFEMEHLEEEKFQITVDDGFIETGRSNLSKEIESLKRNKVRIEGLIKRTENKLANEQETRNQIRLKEQLNKQKQTKKEIIAKIKELSGEKEKPKDIFLFSPIFEMEDLRDGLPVIDRIIRVSLIKYFRENEKNLGNYNDRNTHLSLMRISEKISSALKFTVEHLSPHRNSQTRLYIIDEHTNDIYDLISKHSQKPIKKASKAGKFLKIWMERFDIGVDYNIKPVEGIASMIHIYETDDDKKNETPINLVDKGFGAGQIFTILLSIALKIDEQTERNRFLEFTRSLRRRETIIMIEEPEANLHPALQSELTELFFDAYDNFGIRFIIETHSEYVLRKSQLRVKELYTKENVKELPFVVYYFDKKGPYQMRYRKDGKFKDEFGSGFFDVSTKLAFEIL